MRHHTRCHSLFGLLGTVVALWLLASGAVAGRPAVEGYADYDAYRLQLESIARSELATLDSLGRTRGDREVFLLTIGRAKPDDRPAVLVVVGVVPPHLLGNELAVRLARRLAY